MTSKSNPKVGRRHFLGILGAGASVAAAAGSITTSARADSESNAEKVKTRYRETEHVKAFYRVNKYPTKA